MERRKFCTRIGAGTLAAGVTVPLFSSAFENSEARLNTESLKNGEIRHMVIFNLYHDKGSDLADKFLKDGQQILSNIHVVQQFQVFEQVSLKNDYTYGFSMVFADKKTFDAYINHPDHVAFVENRWKKEVTRFLEIDLKKH